MADEVDRARVVVGVVSPSGGDVSVALGSVASLAGRAVEVDASAVQDLSPEVAAALLSGVLGRGEASAVVVRGASEVVESVLRASAEGLGLSPRLLVL